MADNIAVTAGAGTTIATEDEGGVHYQKVKLTASGTGTTADLTVAEDAVHSTGQHGILAIAVRNDTLAALADTDGDNAPLQVDGSGALYVSLNGESLTVASHAVTNAGTFVVQEDGAALTALQLIDNIVLTEDAVHNTGDSGIMSLAVRNDTLAALAGTDGDYAPLQVNASGALFIQEGSALDVSAATVTVTGTVTANLSATDNAVLDSIDTDTSTIAGDTTSLDGKITACNTGAVVVSTNVLPTGSGTIGSGRALNVTAGTPVQFGTNTCKKVWVTGETDNTGAIWIGDANIVETVGSERGMICYQGQTIGPFEINNTNLLYVDAVNSGDGCTFVYVT